MKYNSSKRYVKALWCALLLFIAAPAVKAQVTVEATIDSLQLLIGEQAKIKLQVYLYSVFPCLSFIHVYLLDKRSQTDS